MDIFILTTLYLLAILLHVLALIICLAFVIPLQIKEAKVKNGLKMLRLQMLGSGLTIIFLSFVSIIALSIPIIFAKRPLYSQPVEPIELYRIVSVFVVFLHALGFFILSLIKRAMYHQQYSDIYKRLHAKAEELEKEGKI